MNKIITILSVVVLVIIIVAGGIVYSSLSRQKIVSGDENTLGQKTPVDKAAMEKSAQEQRDKALLAQAEQIKKGYPNKITGKISFSDKMNTLKTLDGKQYTLIPFLPESMYEYQGIKDGQQVEIQGKFLENNQIEVGSIKPI